MYFYYYNVQEKYNRISIGGTTKVLVSDCINVFVSQVDRGYDDQENIIREVPT